MMKKLFCIGLFHLLLSSCDKKIPSLKVKNNTPNTIVFYTSPNYPDTSLYPMKPKMGGAIPFKEGQIWSRRDFFQTWGKEPRPVDTICVFIFDKDTVNEVPWEKVRARYNILK